MDSRSAPRTRAARAAAIACAAFASVACALRARPPTPAPAGAGASAPVTGPIASPGARQAPPLARFTVLFRRTENTPLGVRVREGVLGDELAEPPVATELLEAALDQTARAWNASGVVSVRRVASTVQPAQIVVSFARGAHGDCPVFGRDRGVAHVWPPGAPSELHLDAGRSWTLGAPPELRQPNVPPTHSLVATLVHELGHAFGLGHSPDPEAALFGDSQRLTPGRSDLAGVRSLYRRADDVGPTGPGPDDVVLESARGARTRLCDVAPAGASLCALADTDADGTAELLVWRTDDAGHGILVVYRFDAELQLVATSGPFVAALLPGGHLELVRLERGLALRSLRGPDMLARAFDAAGVPSSPLPIDAELEDVPALGGLERGDVDGDGQSDRIVQGPVAR